MKKQKKWWMKPVYKKVPLTKKDQDEIRKHMLHILCRQETGDTFIIVGGDEKDISFNQDGTFEIHTGDEDVLGFKPITGRIKVELD